MRRRRAVFAGRLCIRPIPNNGRLHVVSGAQRCHGPDRPRPSQARFSVPQARDGPSSTAYSAYVSAYAPGPSPWPERGERRTAPDPTAER